MNKILKALVIDAETGKSLEVELTPDEIATRKQILAEQKIAEAATEAKVAARESALAKLAALGLTEAEVAAL